jgi:uncharacterized protein YjgD (DUF1641 family)
MGQLGDLNTEAARLVESASDALTDDIVARLATVAGDGLALVDQATQSNLDKALPAISRMVENGDLDRVVNLSRVLGAAGDALSDDIIARLAETGGELLCIADRLSRSEGLMRLLELLEREHVINTLADMGEAAAAAKASHTPSSGGGIPGMLKTMSDPDVQDALKFFATLFKEIKKV